MPTKIDCAAELLTRNQARKSLLHFTNYTFPAYQAEPVHALIAAHLDRVVTGELQRLIITAPPQHGKSELCSVRLPAYWLARRPDDPVILASYAATLAYNKSRHARTVVESPEYRHLFPAITTRHDSRAVDHWQLEPPHRGSLLAVGVGGPVTGHGARLIVLDDPLENWEQAQSETYRQRSWEWWQGTLRPRLWDGGAIVLIMTRWHEDDLAGRLLNSPQAGGWTVLHLQAINAEGEALAPKRFPLAALESIRRDVGSAVWEAEYQGHPTRPEGNWFKRNWFDIVEETPVKAHRVRYWDKAYSDSPESCFTAGVLMSLAGDTYYIEDVQRGQWSPAERDRTIRDTAAKDKRRQYPPIIYLEQEPGLGTELIQQALSNLRGYPAHADRVTASKDLRMQPLLAAAEAHNVKLKHGPWNQDLIDELCALPTGRYRDQADAAAGAFNKLSKNKGSKAYTGRY